MASRPVLTTPPPPTVHRGACSDRILVGEAVTSSLVGHTGARITLADASYHRVLLREAPATESGYKTRPRAAP